jgi:uncharacterized phage-associated protein
MNDQILKYLLFKFYFDGEAVTNLKLQKVLYFINVACLLNGKKNCFSEPFQAWAFGPVLPAIYHKLSKYGASAIPAEEIGLASESELEVLKSELGTDLVSIIDKVYEEYGTKSAFELVQMAHADKAYIKARGDLGPGDKSDAIITPEDILQAYNA